MLATLAATYPRAGIAIEQKITERARDAAGTQVGCYFGLASRLIRGEPEALATALQVATWNDKIGFRVLDDQTVDPGIRALRVLCDAVAACAQ
jgi:hypothetical protein